MEHEHYPHNGSSLSSGQQQQQQEQQEQEQQTDRRRAEDAETQSPSSHDNGQTIFYAGSPMHDYLAEVAPEELPVVPLTATTSPGRSGHDVSENAVRRRRSRRSSKSSSVACSSHRVSDDAAREAEMPSTSETSPRRRSPRAAHHSARTNKREGQSSSSSSTSSNSNNSSNNMTNKSRIFTDRMTRRDNERLNTARERLNLLLVSYLSAPHYSNLPLQDQETIEYETINAFLLDERFKGISSSSSLESASAGTAGLGRRRSGGRRRSRRDSRALHGVSRDGGHATLGNGHSVDSEQTTREIQAQESDKTRPRLIMSRRAQFLFLGLCSLALLTPWTDSSSSSSSSSSATPSSASTLQDLISSLSHGFISPLSTWSWTGAIVKTAPGVVMLTSLATLFARASTASSSSSSISTSSNLSDQTKPEQEQEEEQLIIDELNKLFTLCKKFIDFCTRLDITLEKAFTVLADLDHLAGLEEEGNAQEQDVHPSGEDQSQRYDDQCSESDFGETIWEQQQQQQQVHNDRGRLSSAHPQESASAQYHERATSRTTRLASGTKKIPALDVRRAIFSSLYTVQDRLEKELDALSRSQDISSYEEAGKADNVVDDAEDALDRLELDRLLQMYNCHSSSPHHVAAGAVSNATAQDEQVESTTEGMYRRSMARRSLSPTLYQEQHAAQNPAGSIAQNKQQHHLRGLDKLSKTHRRSGVYMPTTHAAQSFDLQHSNQHQQNHVPLRSHARTSMSEEEYLSRRASWAAFGPHQRSHTFSLQGQSTNISAAAAADKTPSSPSSILHNKNKTGGMATPPRTRPQSIHYGAIAMASASIPASSSAVNPLAASVGLGMGAGATSSPLASGARESNSTIKRERRRRSEQLFPSSLKMDDDTLAVGERDRLRSSTSSITSTSSSAVSSSSPASAAAIAMNRLSVSSQGTSADPLTAASPSTLPSEYSASAYDSPSARIRMPYKRASIGSVAALQQPQATRRRQQRPMSMHELDFGRALHRNSMPQFGTGNSLIRNAVEELPESSSADELEKMNHRNAAAAALERRWYSSNGSTSSTASSQLRTRGGISERPTSLSLLQSSPILSSPAKRHSQVVADSPAASFKSRRSMHAPAALPAASARTKSKFALSSLRESSDGVSRLERALVCHLLALRHSGTVTGNGSVRSSKNMVLVLRMLVQLVDGLNACIHAETTSLTQTMWEEFENTSAPVAAVENVNSGSNRQQSTAPLASVLLSTPMSSNSPFQSTPGKRRSFIACLPGSYPSSPIIEVDPATPPIESDPANGMAQTPVNGSFFRQFDDHDSTNMQEQITNFAPRNPFSDSEMNGRKALAESHFEMNASLRAIATKIYMEKQDLNEYFADARSGGPSGKQAAVQQMSLQAMELRHESLRTDLQLLMRAWEEGRSSLRQLKEGHHRRTEPLKPIAQRLVREASPTSEGGNSEYSNAEEEPSLLTASQELEKHGSLSSVLSSSGNEDSLSTPALSPISQAAYQPNNIAELLLDSTDARHLPRFGMQEQLFEAYVGRDDNDEAALSSKGKGKVSREERIAIAKAKRAEKVNESVKDEMSQPQANMELISELKDMVALLRSRNASILPPQRQD